MGLRRLMRLINMLSVGRAFTEQQEDDGSEVMLLSTKKWLQGPGKQEIELCIGSEKIVDEEQNAPVRYSKLKKDNEAAMRVTKRPKQEVDRLLVD